MIEVKKDVNALFFRNEFLKNNKNIFHSSKSIVKYDKQKIKSLLNEQMEKDGLTYYLYMELLNQ